MKCLAQYPEHSKHSQVLDAVTVINYLVEVHLESTFLHTY